MTVTADHTLAEVVEADLGAVRVLEAFALDYCCGGRRTLQDACTEAGLDAGEVIDALTSLPVGGPVEWSGFGPVEMVDHLVDTHHALLHAELPRLAALVAKVAGVHGGRHPELAFVAATFEELRADLEPHLMKEERILFPMIRSLAAGEVPTVGPPTVTAPISVMLAEHDRAGELLARLRALTDGFEPPGDGCASYRALYVGLAELEADTHLHVHKENNVLFPAVLALEAEAAA